MKGEGHATCCATSNQVLVSDTEASCLLPENWISLEVG